MKDEVMKEKMAEFSNNLNAFLESQTNDEIKYSDLIQEVLGFGVFYSYLNCENPDEVAWVVRKIKQLSLVERKELDKKLMEGSI